MASFVCLRCRNSVTRDGRGNPQFCASCAMDQLVDCLKATRAVSAAIKAGALAPVRSLTCVDCGVPAACYDHRDYTKPLDVDAVCTRCNSLRGPAFSSAYRPAEGVLLSSSSVLHGTQICPPEPRNATQSSCGGPRA